MKASTSCICLAFILCLLPTSVFALAGIAERSSCFHYNDLVEIVRGHPSDLCTGKTKWCLVLNKKDYSDFRDINSSFEELNVPPDSTSPYIFGRLSANDHWIVYDIQQEHLLTEGPNYTHALETWHSLNLNDPVFVNARNTRELLAETRESIRSRWSMDLFLWFFLGVLPLSIFAILFGIASRQAIRKYRGSGSIAYRILSYLFLIPVFAYLYLTFDSLFRIIKINW